MNRPLRAPIFAMPSAMGPDGMIDSGANAALASFLDRHGVPTIIVNGTTGEFPSTTREEKREVLAAARDGFSGSIIAGISGTCVADVIALANDAADHADAFLLLPPYYFASVSTKGLHAFFRSVLRNLIKPTLLYHFPKHTGNMITPELLAGLADEFPRLLGIKDSSGAPESARAFKAAAPRCQVFLGSDGNARAGLDAGVDGPVTGAGNAFPEHLVGLVVAHRDDDEAIIALAEERIAAWRAVRSEVGGDEIAIVKAALTLRVPSLSAAVRPPMVALDERQQEILVNAAQRFGLL